jgi:hypothetical protein
MPLANNGAERLKMARSEEKAASANTATGQSLENSYTGQAGSELGSLLPAFETEAAHPAGFAPADLAKMNTAAEQSAGGSVAGAVGQGNLEAARTRNAGAFQPALDSAAATAGRTLSQDALGVDQRNAMLKEQQRQEGLKGMLGLYDTQTGAGLNALGESNQAINAGTNAANSTQNMWMGPLNSVLSNVTKMPAGL